MAADPSAPKIGGYSKKKVQVTVKALQKMKQNLVFDAQHFGTSSWTDKNF